MEENPDSRPGSHQKIECFRFLELYPEIRDKIYVELLSYYGLKEKPHHGWPRLRYRRSDEWRNQYPSTLSDIPAVPTSFFLCNRQMYEEFKGTLSRVLRYDLDLELTDEGYVNPRWRYIPLRSEHISYFRLTIRPPRKRIHKDLWAPLSALSLMTCLPAVVVRFLRQGPSFTSDLKLHKITIGTLIINVPNSVLDPEDDNQRADRLWLPLDKIVFFLEIYINYLIANSQLGFIRRYEIIAGKLICTRIQHIRLLSNGQEKASWNFETQNSVHGDRPPSSGNSGAH